MQSSSDLLVQVQRLLSSCSLGLGPGLSYRALPPTDGDIEGHYWDCIVTSKEYIPTLYLYDNGLLAIIKRRWIELYSLSINVRYTI